MRITHQKIQKIAEQFWKESRLPINYPVSMPLLEQAILSVHPISIIKLNRVSLFEISSYLLKRGILLDRDDDNKELYGFILTMGRHTFIFINGLESVEEQCFTLAHELAHYILDFWLPRQEAIAVHGDSITDAIDGRRPFTTDERIAALVTDHPLSSYVHLLDEPATSALKRFDIWNAEAAADKLALELIAPYEYVLSDLKKNEIQFTFTHLSDFLSSHLINKFKLTASVAEVYSKYIAQRLTGGISLREKWKI